MKGARHSVGLLLEFQCSGSQLRIQSVAVSALHFVSVSFESRQGSFNDTAFGIEIDNA